MKYSIDKQLEAIRTYLGARDWDPAEDTLEVLIEELDNWLTGGGPLPEEWCRMRRMMEK